MTFFLKYNKVELTKIALYDYNGLYNFLLNVTKKLKNKRYLDRMAVILRYQLRSKQVHMY